MPNRVRLLSSSEAHWAEFDFTLAARVAHGSSLLCCRQLHETGWSSENNYVTQRTTRCAACCQNARIQTRSSFTLDSLLNLMFTMKRYSCLDVDGRPLPCFHNQITAIDMSIWSVLLWSRLHNTMVGITLHQVKPLSRQVVLLLFGGGRKSRSQCHHPSYLFTMRLSRVPQNHFAVH